MEMRKRITSISAAMLVLILFGFCIYSQYSVLIRKDYLGEHYYIHRYLQYLLYGIITSAFCYYLSLRIVRVRGILFVFILMGMVLCFKLLPSQCPLIFWHSGSKYIELFFVRYRISTWNTVILLLVLCIVSQLCSTRWKLLLLSGLGLLFLMLIATEGNQGSTFIAAILFLLLLIREETNNKLFKVIGILSYGVITGGYSLIMLIEYPQYFTIWANPYSDALGKGYMKVQDFTIMKSALLFGNSQYNHTYSGEVLPTVLILFGWGAFVFLVGILLFLQYNMQLLATRINDELSKRTALSITAYFFIKTSFCVLTFLNILPFYEGGHLPFVGYGSELIIDLILMGVYLRCCHGLRSDQSRLSLTEL